MTAQNPRLNDRQQEALRALNSNPPISVKSLYLDCDQHGTSYQLSRSLMTLRDLGLVCDNPEVKPALWSITKQGQAVVADMLASEARMKCALGMALGISAPCADIGFGLALANQSPPADLPEVVEQLVALGEQQPERQPLANRASAMLLDAYSPP